MSLIILTEKQKKPAEINNNEEYADKRTWYEEISPFGEAGGCQVSSGQLLPVVGEDILSSVGLEGIDGKVWKLTPGEGWENPTKFSLYTCDNGDNINGAHHAYALQ